MAALPSTPLRPTVGIIGLGTVGSALKRVLEDRCSLLLCDPALGHHTPVPTLAERASIVFVCVGTPQHANHDADLTAFRTVMGALHGGNAIICVKSAVPPDEVARWVSDKLVISPEFLREDHALEDLLNTRALVLGGPKDSCKAVESLLKNHSDICGEMRTSPGLDAVGAALLKYQENCFLAMKVSFMNEFHRLFERTQTNSTWEALQRSFHLDQERMGSTHWRVPGPDGKLGWGGRCLPKDVDALRLYAKRVSVDTPLLDMMVAENSATRDSS